MLTIFADNWNNPPILNEGKRMLRILTDNDYDYLLVIVDDSVEDLDDELRWVLRRLCGQQAVYNGYEDMSYVCEYFFKQSRDDAASAWDGEGYYAIHWSDGGMWTNAGPVWFDDEAALAGEIYAAYSNSSETHLPYAQKVARFEMYELEALLGESIGDFDVEGILEDATLLTADGNRYWTAFDDELGAIIESWDKRA